MNSRRRSLLLCLPLFLIALFLGPIGTVELVILLVAFGFWVYGFAWWARGAKK